MTWETGLACALVWLTLLQCLSCGGTEARTVTIGMLLDFNVTESANFTTALEHKAAELSTAHGMEVHLRLYHVNDTGSAFRGAAQMLTDNVDVVIGTEDTETTNVVRYTFAARAVAPLLISFCEGAESMVSESHHAFVVSMYSPQSRGLANFRVAELEALSHVHMVTDKPDDGSRVSAPQYFCNGDNVHRTCLVGLTELRPDHTRAQIVDKLRVIEDEGSEIFFLDISTAWAADVITEYLTAVAPHAVHTVFINADAPLDRILQKQAPLLLDNSLVITPFCPPDLEARYGRRSCRKVAHGLDALEVAVRATQRAADAPAGTPVGSVLANVTFTGATGPVRLSDGRRVNQAWTVSVVDGGGLREFGRIVGSADATLNKTSGLVWRGKARQGPAIVSKLHLLVLDDGNDDVPLFETFQRAVDEYNSDVTQSWSTGTTTGAARVLAKRFAVEKHVFGNLSAYHPRSIGAVGPVTSAVAQLVAPVVDGFLQIPVLSTATNAQFSDKKSYPHFVRLMPTDDMQAAFLARVLEYYGWLPVCILSDASTYGLYLASEVHKLLPPSNASLQRLGTDPWADMATVRVAACRTIVVCGVQHTVRLMLELAVSSGLYARRNWVLSDTAELSALDASLHAGLLYAYPAVDSAAVPIRTTRSIFHAYARDSVYTYAHGIAAALAAGHNPFQVDKLREALVKSDFQGLTGRVHFDTARGDRLGAFHLVNLQPSGEKRVVAEASPGLAPAADARARATPLEVTERDTIVFAGNTTTFSNDVIYTLEWGNGTGRVRITNETVFWSSNSGPLEPFPVVRVLQEDLLPISYWLDLSVTFEPPLPPNVTAPTGTSTFSSPITGFAEFADLTFYGARGQTYIMTIFAHPTDPLQRLSGRVQVELCLPTQYVRDYVNCADCPTGAICNGTEVLVAQENYWRTGWYDGNGTYHPNTNEERFLRCRNTACLGGVDSQCKTGTGPYCSECTGDYVFNTFTKRCGRCAQNVGHLFGWIGWQLVQLVLLAVLVRGSARHVGKNLSDWGAVSRILIDWGQQVQVFLQVSHVPDVNTDLGLMSRAAALLQFQQNAEQQMGCFVRWSAYARTAYYVLLPLTVTGLFLALCALVLYCRALWRGRREQRKVPFEEMLVFGESTADRPTDGVGTAYGPLDSQGRRFCELCMSTFAITFCVDESLFLCGACNTRLHPWANPKRLEHMRIDVQPRIGKVGLSVGILCMVMWEAYRLTLIPTVVGLFKWLGLGDAYCDGQPPGDGYCSNYLVTDSSVDGSSSAYAVMLGFVIIALVFWVAVVPGLALGVLWIHRSRLHQDRIVQAWGWLYEAYNWKCCYWEVIVVWRKLLFVIVTAVHIDPQDKYALLLMLCVVFSALDTAMGPQMLLLADRVQQLSLFACSITVATLLLLMPTPNTAAAIVLGINLSASLLIAVIYQRSRPLKAQRLRAACAKRANMTLSRIAPGHGRSSSTARSSAVLHDDDDRDSEEALSQEGPASKPLHSVRHDDYDSVVGVPCPSEASSARPSQSNLARPSQGDLDWDHAYELYSSSPAANTARFQLITMPKRRWSRTGDAGPAPAAAQPPERSRSSTFSGAAGVPPWPSDPEGKDPECSGPGEIAPQDPATEWDAYAASPPTPTARSSLVRSPSAAPAADPTSPAAETSRSTTTSASQLTIY